MKRWINLQMRQFPARIEKERLEELVGKLKAGDRTVEEEIILGHIRIGLGICASNTHLTNNEMDLVSEMFLAITEAVRYCGPPYNRLYDNNITTYISNYIRHYIKRVREANRVLGVPERTVRRWHQMNNEKSRKLIVRVGIIKDDYVEPEYEEEVKAKNKEYQIIPTSKEIGIDMEVEELKYILDKVTIGFLEKKIIALREKGYTYVEVAAQLGIGKSQIGNIINDIEQRFDKMYRERKKG